MGGRPKFVLQETVHYRSTYGIAPDVGCRAEAIQEPANQQTGDHADDNENE